MSDKKSKVNIGTEYHQLPKGNRGRVDEYNNVITHDSIYTEDEFYKLKFKSIEELRKSLSDMFKACEQNFADKKSLQELQGKISSLKFVTPQDLSNMLKACEQLFADKKSIQLLVSKCSEIGKIQDIIKMITTLSNKVESQQVYYQDYTISGDRIRTLFSNPLDISPPPPAGKLFEVHQSSQLLVNIDTAFTIGTQKLQLAYASGEVIWEGACSEVFSASKMQAARPLLNPLVIDAGIQLKITGSDITDGGLSSLKIRFKYSIVDAVS